MDVLRAEINSIYRKQNLEAERLEHAAVTEAIGRVMTLSAVDGACRVITDASADAGYLVGGGFGPLIGVPESEVGYLALNSSDEDLIYSRIHPADLVEKRMLEYRFFQFVDRQPAEVKTDFKAVCRIRIRDSRGHYRYVDNSTQVLRLSPGGKIWIILCCYDQSASMGGEGEGILPRVVNNRTGTVSCPDLGGTRGKILTGREKEILSLVRLGYGSKQIAASLGISVHTVNRHRQNILERLSVANSTEAVMAAEAMGLID